jgi:hypothetical protein
MREGCKGDRTLTALRIGPELLVGSDEEANMEGFNHILNWKLLVGSHEFPGRDGGTCINEAAVVAAGFKYRPIRNVAEMPSCFSRPICQFAMSLNDEAKDRDRQRLLPFVTRLACADGDEIEQQRRIYISSRVTPFMSLERGIEVLEGVLAIGRQADQIALPVAEERMAAAKEKGRTATSKVDKPLLATVKNLLDAMAL